MIDIIQSPTVPPTEQILQISTGLAVVERPDIAEQTPLKNVEGVPTDYSRKVPPRLTLF